MNRPKDSLGPLKRRDGEPVFDEPWQAQVLGIADALVAAGVIAADAWAARLGAILRARAEAGATDLQRLKTAFRDQLVESRSPDAQARARLID